MNLKAVEAAGAPRSTDELSHRPDNQGAARFEVVTFALASFYQRDVFARHYQAHGASAVTIYLDQPALLGLERPGVRTIVCDEAFWRARTGRRPTRIEDRQMAVYKDAYASASETWMLFVDIDEFIVSPSPLADIFSATAPESPSVVFPTVEAVFGPDDDPALEFGASYLRKSLKRPWASLLPPLIYGARGGLFTRGLLGHAMGKHALRTGLKAVDIDIHETKRGGVPLSATRARDDRGRAAWLAHFDAMSFEQWRLKWRHRQATGDIGDVGRKRRAQFDAFVEAQARGAEAALFSALYTLTPWQVRALRALRLLAENPLALHRDDRRSPAADAAARSSR